ncbi:MAG: phytanoyl-CoA dioxygenase family protein [Pseudomonadota bacterium]
MNEHLPRAITEDEIATYQRDGIVLLRQLFDMAWVEHLRAAVAEDMARPGPMCKNVNRGGSGHFFGDTFVWTHHRAFRQFLRTSPVAEIASTVMASSKTNLFFDQILAKAPGTTAPTIWHHDQPFWPVAGEQVCTVWIALDPVTADNGAVEYVKGSHRWGQRFRAESFDENERYGEALPPVPDIEADRARYSFAQFEMAPGDCTVHHGLTVHWAPGNSTQSIDRRAYITRWAGEDATYFPRPLIQKMLYDPQLTCGGPLDCELWPVLWPRPDNLVAPSRPADPRPASG